MGQKTTFFVNNSTQAKIKTKNSCVVTFVFESPIDVALSKQQTVLIFTIRIRNTIIKNNRKRNRRSTKQLL
jgi:hypothetical protein